MATETLIPQVFGGKAAMVVNMSKVGIAAGEPGAGVRDPSESTLETLTEVPNTGKKEKLVKYQALLGQIEKANTIDELKDIANKTEACRMYAKKAGMDLKGQNVLAEGRIRAERKAGKLLKEMDKPLGGRPKTTSSVEGVKRPTLADMGVTKKESYRWQQRANGGAAASPPQMNREDRQE